MNSNMAKAGLRGAALAGTRVALPRGLDLRTLAVPASKGALALFDLDIDLALVCFLVAIIGSGWLVLNIVWKDWQDKRKRRRQEKA